MPAPTSVLRRISDQLVAPRASRGELLVVYITAVAGSALAVVVAADSGMSPLSLAVVAVVAFDLFGGAVANATAAAKRRFHGPGRGWRQHLGFVVAHVQPFVLALVVPGFGWAAAAAIYGLVVAGALVVLAAPQAAAAGGLRDDHAGLGRGADRHHRPGRARLVRARHVDQAATRAPASRGARAMIR